MNQVILITDNADAQDLLWCSNNPSCGLRIRCPVAHDVSDELVHGECHSQLAAEKRYAGEVRDP